MHMNRLDECGWSSFDPQLFLNEPGRAARDVGSDFCRIVAEYGGKEQRVLELCCGAGKLCIALSRAGHDVTGLDLSREMLDEFERQLFKEDDSIKSRVRMIQADMCQFDLKQTFDFIILEDDGFVYLLDTEEQLACLGRVCAHLADGGHFFLSFTTPQRELASKIAYEYEPVRQIKTAPREWTVQNSDGTHTLIRQGIERRRLVFPAELELLLRTSGFEVIERWGDLCGTPFTDPLHQEYNFLSAATLNLKNQLK
jgi:SAM-dependent methyltransferase